MRCSCFVELLIAALPINKYVLALLRVTAAPSSPTVFATHEVSQSYELAQFSLASK